jgi:hypothetical protein
MRIKHRYTVRLDDYTEEIKKFLDASKMKYDISDGTALLTVEIFEDADCWQPLNDLMNMHKAVSFSTCIFTTKEMEEAQWLRIRSKWRQLYPQPEDNYEYKRITYDGFCSDCGCCLTQKENIRAKRTVKWGTRYFVMLNWIEDEMFASDDAVQLLESLNLRGISFTEVLDHRTNMPLSNIKQIRIAEILKPGMILNSNDYVKKKKCAKCGTEKYVLSGKTKLRFSEHVFPESADFVKTSEHFGDGLMCARLILVSQNVYKAINAKKMHKDLIFEPVELV